MRFDQTLIFTNNSMTTGTVTSTVIDLQQIFYASIAAHWTGSGTPAGNFQVQVSNDIVPAQVPQPGTAVVNWQSYAGGTAGASGSGSCMFNFATTPFRWIRLQYIGSSGSAVMNAEFVGKG